MFTLGKKELILNDASQFPVTITAPTGTTSLLNIKGFGAFEESHIVSATAQRFIAGRNASLVITAPDAAALGILAGEINVPVVVHIRVNTSRYTSEWATDFIKRGRPFIFEILVNGGETASTIMGKLMTMFATYEERFRMSQRGLPFSYSATGATATLILKDPYLSFQNNVEFLPRGEVYGVKAVTSRNEVISTNAALPNGSATITLTAGDTSKLLVGDTVTIGAVTGVITDITSATVFVINTTNSGTAISAETLYLASMPQEPIFDGKYLEENVRMSVPPTSDSYAINPDITPKIESGYTALTFVVWEDTTGGIDILHKKHTFLGTTRGELGGRREHTFTLYFLEGSNLFDNGSTVDTILGWFITNGVTPTMTIKNKNAVTIVADFLSNTY
jgi:hypothetical protein